MFNYCPKIIKARRRPGFTIIEVVLVLAIAGLIFLMVFLALPALQRSQRNTQRKNDLTIIVSAMNSWKEHNRSSVSDNYTERFNKNRGFCTFYKRHVGEELADPTTGEPYKAALWNSRNVINCISGEVIDRGEYDETAIGRSPNSHWAKMEVGDIQYDDVAMCDGETFNDDMGRSAGAHSFALRMYLEGGATLCLDSGIKYRRSSINDKDFISDVVESFALAISQFRFFVEH